MEWLCLKLVARLVDAKEVCDPAEVEKKCTEHVGDRDADLRAQVFSFYSFQNHAVGSWWAVGDWRIGQAGAGNS